MALRYAKVCDGICQLRELLRLTADRVQHPLKPGSAAWGKTQFARNKQRMLKTGLGEKLTSSRCRQDASSLFFCLMRDDKIAADRPYVAFKIYICLICELFGQQQLVLKTCGKKINLRKLKSANRQLRDYLTNLVTESQISDNRSLRIIFAPRNLKSQL